QRVDARARHLDCAFARPIESPQEVQQGCLAGSGGSHERQEVAGRDVEVDALKDVDPVAPAPVDFVDVADCHQCGHGVPPMYVVYDASYTTYWTYEPARVKVPIRSAGRAGGVMGRREPAIAAQAEEIVAIARALRRDLLRNPAEDAESAGLTGPQV